MLSGGKNLISMRNTWITGIAFMAALSGSCSKESGNAIESNWELMIRSGGFSGSTQTYAPGNGNAYAFRNDAYQKYTSSQLTKSGRFRVIKDSSYTQHQPANRIIFDNDSAATRTLINFVDTTMVLTEDVYDGFRYTYRKTSGR